MRRIQWHPPIDPTPSCGETLPKLSETKPEPADPVTPAKKRRAIGRWIAGGLLLFLLALVVWLNGPGLRYLAPRVAFHYLEGLGFTGDFRVEGNLTGGISIVDLRMESGEALALLTVDRATPRYRLGDLRKGKLEGLSVSGVHADLRLGLEKEKEDKPLDLENLVRTLRNVRSQVIPLDVRIEDVSLSATKDGEPLLALASSGITHAPGGDVFELHLGEITDARGKTWPAQQTEIVWTEDDLSVARIDPLPGVGIRNLMVNLPGSGELSASTEVHLQDAVLAIASDPGLAAARVDLREGAVQIAGVLETLASFGIEKPEFEIPAESRLTSLAVEVENLMPSPANATGTVRILLEDLAYDGWELAELGLDATLGESEAGLVARAVALGAEISLQADAPLTRRETEFLIGDVTGNFSVPDLAKLLAGLAEKVDAIDPGAPVPDSSLNGNFTLQMVEQKPRSATADVRIQPADDTLATPVSVRARWEEDQPVDAGLTIDGLELAMRYRIEEKQYEGSVKLDDFRKERIDRWLAVARVDLEDAVTLAGEWSGNGDLQTGVHQGSLALRGVSYTRPDSPEINGTGTISYDWPGNVEVKDLRVTSEDQSLALEAALADGFLRVSRLLWTDGETEMLEGTAGLPVPEDFTKWRETLANDTRPLEVSVESRVLSLEVLKPWLPETVEIDPRSTAQLTIRASGTYPQPEIKSTLQIRDLRSPANPDIPPADIAIELDAREERISVNGTVTAPDFPPAFLKMEMPFRPAAWAEEPGLVAEETFQAEVELPRLDLARFSTLVPAAKQIMGVVTGNLTAEGKLSDPVLRGNLRLADAGIVLTNPDLPEVRSVSANIDLNLDRILLENLRATIGGGTITGGGSVALEGAKPGEIDLRITGDHLPIVRNEQMIVRAGANLRLQGSMEDALLSGTVGIVDSLFFRDIELLPIGRPFTGPAAASLPKIDNAASPTASVPEPFRNWRLDVTARTDEPFLIRGNLGKGEAHAAIRVSGTLGNPTPNGTVRARDVVLSLPFSRLEIPSGFLRFTPENGLNPTLEVRGQSEIRPYRVNIYVHGSLEDPQLVLTSSPPLPDNEIMTLLATGTTTSGLEDPQAASARAFQLLIEEARRGRLGFARQLRPVLQVLDRVDFNLAESDPYANDTYTTATVRLSDRWFFTAGMGTEGNTRYLGMWRFSFR